MKLVYRGVPYCEDKPKLISGAAVSSRLATRRGYARVNIKSGFPVFRYLKQLFQRSKSKPIIDPVSFWYLQKRSYLNACFLLNELELLERCWYLTLVSEQELSKPARPIKLKYRGVTYYR